MNPVGISDSDQV